MKKRLLLILTLAPLSASADDPGREAVIATIDAFFDAMTARDVESMSGLMTPDGLLFGYRETAEGPRISQRTHAEYLEGLAAGDARLVERYWDPVVMISGRLATVWTPYDFHVDGQFSHCGLNNFSLLQTEDGWMIAGVVYSMQVDDCEESPLGAFAEDSGQ